MQRAHSTMPFVMPHYKCTYWQHFLKIACTAIKILATSILSYVPVYKTLGPQRAHSSGRGSRIDRSIIQYLYCWSHRYYTISMAPAGAVWSGRWSYPCRVERDHTLSLHSEADLRTLPIDSLVAPRVRGQRDLPLLANLLQPSGESLRGTSYMYFFRHFGAET